MDARALAYEELCRLLLDALRSVVEEHSATYVAGPLATGPRYYEELLAGILVAEDVRRLNELDMRSFVRTLRERAARPVIDSGVLRVAHWSGSEHGEFFMRVISELCREVVFLNGWEFSSGATKEFIFSLERGIRCLDASGIELTLVRGERLITRAMTVVRGAGGPLDVFERRLQALTAVRDREIDK